MRSFPTPLTTALKTKATLAGAACVAAVVVVGPAAHGQGSGPLPPINLTGAGADGQRVPFARWTPDDYPIVNIRVSTRPVRGPGTQPAARFLIEAGSYDRIEDGPEALWRSENDPLVPGTYYTAIQGDAASQGGMPWTGFKRFRVKARNGEWTGNTSQKRYIRFRRKPGGAISGLAFSVFARGTCGTFASLSVPGRVAVDSDGRFSVRARGRSKRFVGTADVRITGRVRRGFARGTLRVDDLFEGCSSGRVRWSARRR